MTIQFPRQLPVVGLSHLPMRPQERTLCRFSGGDTDVLDRDAFKGMATHYPSFEEKDRDVVQSVLKRCRYGVNGKGWWKMTGCYLPDDHVQLSALYPGYKWLRPDLRLIEGECSRLSDQVAVQLQQQLGHKYNFYVMKGLEPFYFSSSKSSHYYVVALDKQTPDRNKQFLELCNFVSTLEVPYGKEAVYAKLPAGMWVIDPAFKKTGLSEQVSTIQPPDNDGMGLQFTGDDALCYAFASAEPATEVVLRKGASCIPLGMYVPLGFLSYVAPSLQEQYPADAIVSVGFHRTGAKDAYPAMSLKIEPKRGEGVTHQFGGGAVDDLVDQLTPSELLWQLFHTVNQPDFFLPKQTLRFGAATAIPPKVFDGFSESESEIIQSIFDRCHYGVLPGNWDNLRGDYLPGEGIRLFNFHQPMRMNIPSEAAVSGICRGLTYQVARILHAGPLGKDYLFCTVVGKSPKYFNRPGASHLYIVALKHTEDDLNDQFYKTLGQDNFHVQDVPKGIRVIDPSFKHAGLSGAIPGYQLTSNVFIAAQMLEWSERDFHIIPYGKTGGQPIGFMADLAPQSAGKWEEGTLVYLGVRPTGEDNPPRLRVLLQEGPGATPTEHELPELIAELDPQDSLYKLLTKLNTPGFLTKTHRLYSY